MIYHDGSTYRCESRYLLQYSGARAPYFPQPCADMRYQVSGSILKEAADITVILKNCLTCPLHPGNDDGLLGTGIDVDSAVLQRLVFSIFLRLGRLVP